jgi:hypothetical protein
VPGLILTKSLVLGEVTLARVAAIEVPATLAPAVEAIARAFEALQVAHATVEDEETAHRAVIDASHAAWDAVVAGVEGLAGAITQADPSVRLRPFASFDSDPPSDLLRGARPMASADVARLAIKVIATRPAAGISRAARACIRANVAMRKAWTRRTGTTVTLALARDKRNDAHAEFTLAYQTARQVGKRVWKKTPWKFDAVFGPLDRSDYSPKQRPKKDLDPTTPTD